MIKSLNERIAARTEEFNKGIANEHNVQKVLDVIEAKMPLSEMDVVSVYDAYAYIYIHPKDFDAFEIEILPYISELFDVHWKRHVTQATISYNTSISENGSLIRVHASPRVPGTCKIISHPTGKMIKQQKYVEIDVPEVEYLVECFEE